MTLRKNKLRGFTLIEIIVSLAVLTIISALLVSACAGICSIIRKTEGLNSKIIKESPAAEIRDNTVCVTPTEENGSEKEAAVILQIEGRSYRVIGKEYFSVIDEKECAESGHFRFFEGNIVTEVFDEK
ncbi:MAG: prepilin-type N-terminal cleavage/methylation domain-containing protein [Oscillospiraceae bacterium]|nr:prepilin-type N-terminal cleavage/methylation domain-containing protein [Oscillospiraceae bacterium]